METRTIETIESELPSGLKIKFREPSARDELKAQSLASREPEENRVRVATWAMMMLCTVSINGSALDQTKLTPDGYRDMFGLRDFQKATELWFQLYEITPEQEQAFQDSKRIGSV